MCLLLKLDLIKGRFLSEVFRVHHMLKWGIIEWEGFQGHDSREYLQRLNFYFINKVDLAIDWYQVVKQLNFKLRLSFLYKYDWTI